MHVKEMFDLIIVSIFLIIISRLIENFEAACIKLSIYYNYLSRFTAAGWLEPCKECET